VVELIESKGGVFEVRVDGRLVFSKKALKRFPAYQEIPELIETAPTTQ
jgi:selT/selW/selH-like putative selenoprotein